MFQMFSCKKSLCDPFKSVGYMFMRGSWLETQGGERPQEEEQKKERRRERGEEETWNTTPLSKGTQEGL